ncbi:hypothetical protein SK128_002318 [Halocaridina rubra]|uniref:Uncharacterized protein n=1 Tax=Halocaridina rubra TaxID=373956 RepID=A0AAN8XL08_HALRR
MGKGGRRSVIHLILCSFSGVKPFDPKLDMGPEIMQMQTNYNSKARKQSALNA